MESNKFKSLKNKEKMAMALDLLHQILEKAKEDDLELKKIKIYQNKGVQTIGDSFVVHYLGNLRELLLLIQRDLE